MNRHMPQNDALRDRLDAILSTRPEPIPEPVEAWWAAALKTLVVCAVIVGLLVWLPIKLFGGIVP